MARRIYHHERNECSCKIDFFPIRNYDGKIISRSCSFLSKNSSRPHQQSNNLTHSAFTFYLLYTHFLDSVSRSEREMHKLHAQKSGSVLLYWAVLDDVCTKSAMKQNRRKHSHHPTATETRLRVYLYRFHAGLNLLNIVIISRHQRAVWPYVEMSSSQKCHCYC